MTDNKNIEKLKNISIESSKIINAFENHEINEYRLGCLYRDFMETITDIEYLHFASFKKHLIQNSLFTAFGLIAIILVVLVFTFIWMMCTKQLFYAKFFCFNGILVLCFVEAAIFSLLESLN